MFYLFLFILIIILLFFSAHYKSRPDFFMMLFFLILFIVPGLRGDVGQDTFSYQIHYNYIDNFDSFLSITKTREPFIYIIMYLHKLLFGSSYTGLLLIVAFLQTLLLYFSTKNLYHKYFFLFFYIVIFYFEFHFNVLRASMALLFFLCSLSYVNINKKKALYLLLLSILSHISVIVLLPVLIARMNISSKNIIYIILFCILIGGASYILFGDLIYLKSEGYNLLDFSKARLPIVVTGLLLIAWIGYFTTLKISKETTVCLMIFSFFYMYSGVSDIAYRFYLISLCCLLFLVSENKKMSLVKLRVNPFNIGITCILLWVSYININFVIHERERRLESGEGLIDFTYMPYELYYQSNNR